jgi:hypothetical protein
LDDLQNQEKQEFTGMGLWLYSITRSSIAVISRDYNVIPRSRLIVEALQEKLNPPTPEDKLSRLERGIEVLEKMTHST